MKIKPNFKMQSVAGDYVVMEIGDAVVDLTKSFTLNESGAFLWGLLQSSVSEEELVQALLQEYDVDAVQAEADVKAFLNDLSERQMLES